MHLDTTQWWWQSTASPLPTQSQTTPWWWQTTTGTTPWWWNGTESSTPWWWNGTTYSTAWSYSTTTSPSPTPTPQLPCKNWFKPLLPPIFLPRSIRLYDSSILLTISFIFYRHEFFLHSIPIHVLKR